MNVKFINCKFESFSEDKIFHFFDYLNDGQTPLKILEL